MTLKIARLQTLDDFGLASAGTALEPLEKLDQLIDELRDMAWGGAGDEWAPPAPSSASASPASQRRNLRYLTRVLLHRQAEIRRLEHELTATQVELETSSQVQSNSVQLLQEDLVKLFSIESKPETVEKKRCGNHFFNVFL